MEEQFKRLAGQVARFLSQSEETVAGYAESDDATKALATAFKEHRTKIDTDAYQRGEAKTHAKYEKSLKARGATAPSSENIEESLDEVVTTAASQSGSTLTDEQVLALPLVRRKFTDLENEKLRVVAAAKEAAEAGLKAERTAFTKEKADAKIEGQARKLIERLNPNLNTDDAQKIERKIKRLVDEVKAGHFKEEKDGSFSPVDEQGKYLESGAGIQSFDEYVREVVTTEYDLPASQPRQTAQLTPEQLAAGRTADTYRGPTTQDDLDLAIIQHASDPKKVEQLQADFKVHVTDKLPS